MVNDFDEVVFPEVIARGSTSVPRWRTEVVIRRNASEKRNAVWSQPLSRFNARNGIETMDQLGQIITFFHARNGRGRGFLYKDWSDYTTGQFNTGSPTFADCNIGTGNGSTVAFQMKKFYVSGPVSQSYNIYKPKLNTVLVGLAGIQQLTGWTVNYTTGILTFTVAPGIGVAITIGCEFYKPVRFDVDELVVNLTNFKAGSVDCPMVEIPPC